MDQIERLEEKLAHLMKAVEEMSDRMHAQGQEIDRLVRRVAMLMEREAGREADGLAPGDPNQRPPHW